MENTHEEIFDDLTDFIVENEISGVGPLLMRFRAERAKGSDSQMEVFKENRDFFVPLVNYFKRKKAKLSAE